MLRRTTLTQRIKPHKQLRLVGSNHLREILLLSFSPYDRLIHAYESEPRVEIAGLTHNCCVSAQISAHCFPFHIVINLICVKLDVFPLSQGHLCHTWQHLKFMKMVVLITNKVCKLTFIIIQLLSDFLIG